MSDQERANVLCAKANDLHNAGQKLEAAPIYVEAANLFTPYASFALVAGDSYAAAGKDELAIAAYRTCLAGCPDHEQAWLGLGQVLHKIGKQEEAREAFKHAGEAIAVDAKPGCLKRLFGIG